MAGGRWWSGRPGSSSQQLVVRRRHASMWLVVVAALGVASARDLPDTSSNTTSSRAFVVDTSVPFSVAPQPVKDTAEVALAKEKFMETFQLIRDAVIAADAEQLNITFIENEVKNHIDALEDSDDDSTTDRADTPPSSTTTQAPTTTTAAPTTSKPPVFAGVGRQGFVQDVSIFPDPLMEPEYFLPSIHIDPHFMEQLDVSLPPNPWIQEMRPMGGNGKGGHCYELILLEEEEDHFSSFPRGGSIVGPPGSLTFPSHSSLLQSLQPIQGRSRSFSGFHAPVPSRHLPVGTPAVRTNHTGMGRITTTALAHTLGSQDIPDTARIVSSAVRRAHSGPPAHFRAPRLSFPSFPQP